MNSPLLNDRRAAGLLNRVLHDVSHLRDDIGNLLTHTTRETLPNSARDLAGQARNQLFAGGAYAASRLRNLRVQPARQSAGWLGGAILAGAVAYGIYALCHRYCPACRIDDSGEPDPEDSSDG